MHRARLLFSTNYMPASVGIRVATWSRFSHVDFIVPKTGTVIGALALKGGVTEYLLKDRLSESTHWAIYEYDADADRVLAHLRTQVGKPYDWLACVGIFMHRDWQQSDAWECSELQGWAAQKSGCPLVNPQLRLNRVSPETLLRSPQLRLVDTNWRKRILQHP